MRELVRLHSLRWAERGEAGVLADPLLRRLLEDAGPALAAAGLLRMQRLVVGTQTAAVLFALHGDGQTCCFLSGFDPAFARLSPVTALIGATIAQAVRDGDRSVDFLRGEEPYKLGWGAVPQAMHRRSLRACLDRDRSARRPRGGAIRPGARSAAAGPRRSRLRSAR